MLQTDISGFIEMLKVKQVQEENEYDYNQLIGYDKDEVDGNDTATYQRTSALILNYIDFQGLVSIGIARDQIQRVRCGTMKLGEVIKALTDVYKRDNYGIEPYVINLSKDRVLIAHSDDFVMLKNEYKSGLQINTKNRTTVIELDGKYSPGHI